jgi:pimeloyl-ACP methyl ester carboxylesterase
MPNLTLNGASTHYTDQGTSNPTPLVLLHGFPLDSRMWAAQSNDLASHARVIAPDFRGFGRSAPTGPFSLDQLADDAHALVDLLGLKNFVLAGLSMGGYVALAYVKKYPGTLRGLILIDTQAGADTPESRQNRDRLIATTREHGAKPVADAMLGKLIPEATAKSRPQLVRDLRQMMDATNPQTIAHALAAMRDRADHTATLATIDIPTLIVVGDQDAITPPDVARRMQEKIPGAQLKVVTGSGHMSPMEQPAQVNAATSDFLLRL